VKSILILLIGSAVLLAACDPPNDNGTQQPAAAAPSITSRPSRPPNSNPFGGFIYPAGGTLAYPGSGGSPGWLELDAPIRTILRDSDGNLAYGGSYFAFTVNVQVHGVRLLDLEWQPADGQAVTVTEVEGPCDVEPAGPTAAGPAQCGVPASPATREFMLQASCRDAGVPAVAAYDLATNAMLDSEQPVWWVTCDPDDPGEVVSGSGSSLTVDYNVAVLLPLAAMGDQRRGRLQITSRPLNPNAGTPSEPLIIQLSASPELHAVVGDSVAWGQGLNTQDKFWFKAYNERLAPERPARIHVLAHSAARISQSETASINSARAACGSPQGLAPQELPFGTDSVQCQIARLAQPFCYIDADQLGQPGVVPAMSCSNADSTAPEAFEAAEQISFAYGPRFDFTYMTGCINDVGPVWLHTAVDGSLTEVVDATDQNCDIRNSLPDIRQELPNAAIYYLGYHLTWSEASQPLSILECPAAAELATAYGVLGFPFNLFLIAGMDSSEEMATRVGLFWERSNEKLAESINALGGPAPGRGSIRFVPLDFFNPLNAAYAPASLNFELDCVNPVSIFGPLDPARASRSDQCAAAIDTSMTLDEIASLEEIPPAMQAEVDAVSRLAFCTRASFLHPNVEANRLMFQTLRSLIPK
jgi:hypothetical protein